MAVEHPCDECGRDAVVACLCSKCLQDVKDSAFEEGERESKSDA